MILNLYWCGKKVCSVFQKKVVRNPFRKNSNPEAINTNALQEEIETKASSITEMIKRHIEKN